MAKDKETPVTTNTPDNAAPDKSANLLGMTPDQLAAFIDAKIEEGVRKRLAETSGPAMTASDAKSNDQEKLNKWLEEEVEIQLFKDTGKYKEDLFVAINGIGMTIPRGRPVKIKRKYWLVIKDSLEQDMRTAEMVDRKAAEFEAKTKALG